jgi:hypothetical protein
MSFFQFRMEGSFYLTICVNKTTDRLPNSYESKNSRIFKLGKKVSETDIGSQIYSQSLCKNPPLVKCSWDKVFRSFWFTSQVKAFSHRSRKRRSLKKYFFLFGSQRSITFPHGDFSPRLCNQSLEKRIKIGFLNS